MKKLCVDARMLFSSGIGTYLRNILQGLQKEKQFTISVIVPEKFAQEKEIAPFSKIFCKAPIYSIEEQLALPFFIPSCDLFWSPHFNVPLAKIRAKRRIVTLCDIYFFMHQKNLSWLKKKYAQIFYQKAIDASERVITISSFSEREIRENLKRTEQKIVTIPLGVERQDFVEGEKKRKLPSSFFLYVGNLKPNKNLERLFRAFSKLSSENPSLSLAVISRSKKQEREKIIREAFSGEKLPSSIIFFEDVSNKELPFFYKEAISLVFPSLYEGFGLPPLEAMIAECPVLASNIEVIQEVCKSSVLYFDPYQEGEIYQRMKQVLEDTQMREELREKGKIYAKNLSWEKTIKSHVTLFEEILEKV